MRQAAGPFREVEKLLGTLIEGWSVASENLPRTGDHETRENSLAEEAQAMPYGAYWSEPVEAVPGAAFSF